MPITPFNDLRNPYSVNQPTVNPNVDTGTGYGIIVRLMACSYDEWLNNLPTLFCGGTCNLANTGISVYNWSMGSTGQPADPTYTAFISQDDYLNSDMNQIATSPLMWEVGQNIYYSFEADITGHQVIQFCWEIIEIVDETTYAAGAGVPQGQFISQATYGEIPVGTITATAGDPNCNGCSDLYNVLNVTTNQNEIQNNVPGPWHELNESGPMDNPNTSPNGFTGYIVDGVNGFLFENTCTSWMCMSRGMYIGTYACIRNEQSACRNPNAWNFDKTTTNYFNTGVGGIYDFGRPFQLDCDGAVFDPSEPTGNNGFGDESCCIWLDGLPGGSDEGACIDPNAANYDPNATEDCSGITGGTDFDCCTYFHLWKICGAHGGYVTYFNSLTSFYVNLTGNWGNKWDATQQNTPATNEEFMTYLLGYQGAPPSMTVGDVIQLTSAGMPGNWWCLEYMGTSDKASNYWETFYGGSGTGLHWNSNSWWNTPPAVDGNGDLIVQESCESCINDTFYPKRYRVCDGQFAGEYINIINDWATDPQDEADGWAANQGNPNYFLFELLVNYTQYSCNLCTNPYPVIGMTFQINWNGTIYCLEYVGQTTSFEGSATSGWIEGVGAGTDNFFIVDPTDPLQMLDINNSCIDCANNQACIPICTDPNSSCFINGPYTDQHCDCNGNPLPSNQALGWNDCCCENPCDDRCNDPLANNYVAGATGCCGSGPGIGTPTNEFVAGNCSNTDTNPGIPMLSVDMYQYMTVQANNLTSIDVSTIQYEDMDTPYLGLSIPANACTGPTGGYMATFAAGDGWIPDAQIAPDINPGAPATIYTDWDSLITQCITATVTGVTTSTTLSELNALLTAWNPAGAGIPASITPPTVLWCECLYASYGPNYDCCTYNWECIPQLAEFAQNWPTEDSLSAQGRVRSEYNAKFGPIVIDVNPRPESTFNHTNDSGYIFPGLDYLRTPLVYSTFRNLGLHFNNKADGQGWAGGKQPKTSYTQKYPQEWGFAYAFMQALTTGEIDNGDNIDLTKAYYKVKTNMLSIPGTFLNANAKVITEPKAGGTVSTGLYYHIVPTGAITIPKAFQSTFPTMGGVHFKTWHAFISELRNYGLPTNVSSWQNVSDFIIDKASESPGIDSHSARLAAPEFVSSTMQFMTQADDGCTCVQDVNGPFSTQWDCKNQLIIDGFDNCCACIYGCTDPNATNYNPLATCDDGSCVGCNDFVIRFCNDTQVIYYRAYLDDGNGALTAQNCANSLALITAWGFTSYWDIAYVNYSLGGNDPTEYCAQWVSTDSQEYVTWSSGNSTTAFIADVNDVVAGNFTYTPWNNGNVDEMCQFCSDVPGCTDPNALNFNFNCAGQPVVATVDDNCCEYCVYGCMDDTASVGGFPDINGHGSLAVYDCAASTTVPITPDLCPHPCATGYQYSNYSPCATCDDGTCTEDTFHKWTTCGDVTIIAITAPGAIFNDVFAQQWFYNYVSQPAIGETINIAASPGEARDCYEYMGPDSSSPATGLTPIPQLTTWEYNQNWNTSCESCQCIYGCTDDTMCNFDPAATCDDGTCCNETGCLDPQAFNYCPTCCCDGPCTPIIEGCMDTEATNYNPLANTPCSYCCEYIVYGCTDPTAINYDPTATVNQVSETDTSDPCEYTDQCKREIKKYGADPTKKLNVECDFASDVYKEYRKERYGLSNYCGSDLPDHLHEKELCDWEDRKRPAYLSSVLTVLAIYEYPIVDGEPYWNDPFRPAWTKENCGLTPDVDIDMYFFYDCTSMGVAAIEQQRNAVDDWINGFTGRGLPEFQGNIYHTLTCGERWIDWATTIFTGVWNNAGTCGGTDSYCVVNSVPADYGNCLNIGRADAVAPTNMSVTSNFWAPMAWGNGANKPFYSSAPLGYDNGPITHLGYPPVLVKREVLGVFFADESATSGTPGTGLDAQPYHINGCASYCVETWSQATDGTGSAGDGSDAVLTECYKADYDEYIAKYNEHLAKGPNYKATMIIYPAKPLGAIATSHRGFPLHALAAVSSGNKTPKDGRYGTGTAPNNSLVDLSKIEVGNPYWDTPNSVQPVTHTFGYGGLDNYGWNANVTESTFSKEVFENDLEEFWDPNKLKCDGTECIILTVVNQNNVAIPDYDIYVDGGFVGKTDEFGRLNFQIENADVKTHHVINLCLCLETEGNCRQQNVKIVVQEECAPACCDEPSGVSCEPYEAPVNQIFEGCMDPNASNYNPMATVDDGSCMYCDPAMIISETHVDASMLANDGSISATVINGTLPYTFAWTGPGGFTASTPNITNLEGGVYNLTVTDDNDCISIIIVNLDQPPMIFGCMKDDTGYWPNINGLNQLGNVCSYPCTDDGLITGNPNGYKYFCYNPDASVSDDCCEAGCTDPNAIITGLQGYCPACMYDCNMDPIGTFNVGWDSCCELCTEGCRDPIACNYDASANCDCIDCCEYCWICKAGSWTINEIDQYNYQLSGYNANGIFVDTSCTGICDPHTFWSALADYYSSGPQDNIWTSSEITAVQGGNMWYLGASPCPLCVIDAYYLNCEQMPLGTIGGYTTENPWGPTATSSCYAQLQITTFGAGYVFPSWNDYKTWHNGAGGPNQICTGTQIPVIVTANWSLCNNWHAAINPGNDPFNPQDKDNWIYYTSYAPTCDGYSECDCIEVISALDNNGSPGIYPDETTCDGDITTCCGEGGPGVGGCIDNGFVGLHPDFANSGASTEQEWWDGQNAAGIVYSMHNTAMTKCEFGIVHNDALINGGSGTVGLGTPTLYPTGIPAYNYDPLATFDDGSCCYCAGCMDEAAAGYEPGACMDDPTLCGSGSGSGEGGCMDPAAITYDGTATTHLPSACGYSGCLQSGSLNYGNFEVNNLPTYEWAGNLGYVYGLPDIIAGCTSCCVMATTGFECIQSNLQNPTFEDNGTIITPGFQNRFDATTEYQVTQNGTGCQTMFTADTSLDDPQNIMYMWSHPTPAVADFNNWYYYFALATSSGQCINTQSHMDNLYSNTGWTSPAGINSFTIGSQSPWDSSLFSWCTPQFLMNVQLIRTGGNTIVHEVTWQSVDRTWATFRDTLINTYGWDGNTEPDLTGLDFDQVWQIVGPGNHSTYHLHYSLAACINGGNAEWMCLQTPNGGYATCGECSNRERCGTCI